MGSQRRVATEPSQQALGGASVGTVELGARALRRQRRITLAVVVAPLIGFVAALALLWGRAVGLTDLVLLGSMYLLTMMGVEVGLHRHFSHHGFDAPRAIRVGLGVLGSMAAQGPVLFWAATHRRHHQFSDRPGDPHSPQLEEGDGWFATVRGLWHAHAGWLFGPELTDMAHYAPDLLCDRAIFTVHRLYPVWVASGLALPALIGGTLDRSWSGAASGLLWGGIARVFLVHHATWSVNSICHAFGQRPFSTRDDSRNNIWLALTSLGGSWHNNHHAFPASAICGLRWWQVDPGAWVIRALELVGLAWDVKRPAAHQIAARETIQRGAPS